MADIDIVIDIYQSTSTAIGTKSPYASIPHPGTGKPIKGWEWDKRTWPAAVELKATDFVPTVFDPDTNFVSKDKFQSGIGDNKDLALLALEEEQASNVRYWTPRINHGYFYMHDEQWYLYSDDAVRMIMDATVLSGVLQYKDLEFNPKPTVPISVYRYKWNPQLLRYEIDKDFRKKEEFTGIVTNGVEADTVASGRYLISNIDASKPEFVVDYDENRVVLNSNYEEQIGTSGTWNSLEFIAVSDGNTNEYHLPYAPVSPSGLIQLMTFDERTGTTYSWSRIDQTSEFSEGAFNEYKLDDHLGIITFGDYDSETQSGAGARPGTFHQIAMVYTRGLELIYEPEHTRDWIEPRTADVNPFRNPSSQGFVKVSSQQTNDPQYITLAADLDGSVEDGYTIDLSNKTARLLATVLSVTGDKIEGQTVTFELLEPIFGTFSNLDLEAQSLTNINGIATTRYVPPSSIENIGRATTSVATIAGNTTITVDGLIAPPQVEDVYLFKVLTTDPVLGLNPTLESSFFSSYLNDEGIEEDPAGSAATQDFEETFRESNGLPVPLVYEAGDIITGAKVIVSRVDAGVVDPNYATQNATDPDYANVFTTAPLIPYSTVDAGGSDAPVLELTYSGVLDVPDGSSFKSYFVVCPATTRIRAKVVNSVTGKTIYSNVISISISVPQTSGGVKILEDLDDVQNDLFNRVKHIDEINDDTILSSSGELWAEYLEDRIFTSEVDQYTHWSSDSFTIGYWPMESGSLRDSSSFGNHLDNVGGMIPIADGFIGSGYQSTSPGTPQYLDAATLYTDLSLHSGTIDFLFKTDVNTPSGTTFKMFEFTVTGYDNSRTTLEGITQQMDNSGIWFRFNYGTQLGVGATPQAYLLHNLLENGIFITNSEWHTFRVSWNYDFTSQQITLAGQIDGQTMSGGVPVASLGFLPSGLDTAPIGGKLQAVVGDLSAIGGLNFDEVRYSKTVRNDVWPPVTDITTEESFIDWFRRTRKADSNRLLLQSMVFSGQVPARLPLGFRLKSAGITVASLLDRVTFTTLNDHLPDDYFDGIEE